MYDQLLDDLIDEVTLGVVFETHRAAKLGYLFLDESNTDEAEESHAIVTERGLDVFGEAISSSNGQIKKQLECVCPTCDRSLAAQRFAPHLEKCMGMGRNSSRIASKRIASSTGKAAADGDDDDCDNSGDTDWIHDNKKRKRKDKNGSGGLAVKKVIKKRTQALAQSVRLSNNSPKEANVSAT